MRLHGAATLGWHMRFVASIYPGWDASYADTLLRRFNLHPEQAIKALSHGERVKADAAARARAPSAAAAARRADDRPRSRGAARSPRRADGRRPRRAPRDPVLVAQHAGRRADLRSDHVHRPRPDHRFERQGDVPRSLAPPAPRCAAPARRCRAARRDRDDGERARRGRHDKGVHAGARRRSTRGPA